MKHNLTVEDLKKYVTNSSKFAEILKATKIEWFSAGRFDKSWLEELSCNLTIGILLEATEKYITHLDTGDLLVVETMSDDKYRKIVEDAGREVNDFNVNDYLKEHPAVETNVLRKCWVLHSSSPNMRIRQRELIDCLWVLLQARLGKWKSVEKEQEEEE